MKKNHNGKLKIIPLGGLEQIGMNITAFEYEDSIVVVDCGLSFPENDMLGIDLVIPDVTYLKDNISKVKGFVITHGHEDHIGAVPYLLKKINIPIYATKLTAGLIRNKLEEHKILRSTEMHEVVQGQTISLGKNFKVEFIRSSHSIPDSVMLAITTPAGTVLHTGDFKVDYTPIDGKIMDFGRIAELGNQGILALMSDSTNAERKGFTMSESSVGEVFDKLFLHCTKRIVVATFASNVHRVQQIVNSAVKYNRKIAVCGRSMINMITTARELGYIECPENIFIDIDMINNYPDENLVIITTGSQGEPMSALTRMANGEHKKVNITANDLVIISATPIPGNEKFVSKVIDDLMQIGAEVVYSSLEAIHVSGHACQEEQKLIIALAKPKYFIPVHGEYRQLIAHSETAKSLGFDDKNIFLLTNGRILELNQDEANFLKPLCYVLLFAGLRIGEALALKWKNIDFDNKTIKVERAITQVPKFDEQGNIKDRITVIGDTKTTCSIREIPVADIVIKTLIQWKNKQTDRQQNNPDVSAILTSPTSFVFANDDGSYRTYSGTRKIFDRFKRRNGLDKFNIHFHGLRHTNATLLISQNIDVAVVAARLGHAQITTTFNFYVHPIISHNRNAGNVLQNLLLQKN